MFAYTLLLVFLLPLTFLCSTIETLFSPEELREMGIHIERQQAENLL